MHNGGNKMLMYNNEPLCYEPNLPMPVMPIDPKYAHAYVPFQYLKCVYSPIEGLHCGTIFPELNRPYGADPEYLYDA